jgi:hypothetical protein
MILEVKAAIAALALILVAACLWGLWHHGYAEGAAARDAYYAPLLEAARAAKAAADAKADEQETAQEAITADITARHAHETDDLQSRLAAAERSTADVLRHYAACPGGGQVRPVPDAAATRAAPGGGDAGAPAGGPGSRLTADAGQCEHDARELAKAEEWITEQRALSERSQQQ